MAGRWTVVIPWVAPELATEWHPTDKTGPFSTLTRGDFGTQDEAARWGEEKLKGTPYSTKQVS